jgi:hypothetical protein
VISLVAIFPLTEFISEDKPVTTLNVAVGGGNVESEEIQMYSDLSAITLGFELVYEVVGQGPDPGVWAPFQFIRSLVVVGDGHSRRLDLQGLQIRPVHRVFNDVDAFFDTATVQTTVTVHFTAMLPCPIFKDSFKVVEIRAEFAEDADFDDIEITTGGLAVTAHYGPIDRELRLLNHQEEGAGPVTRIPTIGVLQGIIVQDDEGLDTNITNIRLTHEGNDLVDDGWVMLKAKTQMNDKSIPLPGYNSVIAPAVQPVNNTYLTIAGTQGHAYSYVWIYCSVIAVAGPRTGPLTRVPRVPLDVTKGIGMFPIGLQRDLRLGTQFYQQNPFKPGLASFAKVQPTRQIAY